LSTCIIPQKHFKVVNNHLCRAPDKTCNIVFNDLQTNVIADVTIDYSLVPSLLLR